jgi:hypothetical protein
MMYAKLSTAITIPFGPVLDSTGAEYTSAVVGDVKISKNNGTPAALNGSATLTHKEVGNYELVLTTSDISAVGQATITLSKTTYVAPPRTLVVLPPAVYDSLVGGTATAGGLVLGSAAYQLAVDSAGKVAVPDTQKVDLNTIKTQTVTCAGGVTVPAATLASTTNLTAGTVATVTNAVLVSAGTGAGQLDITSGVVKANLVQILASAITGTAANIVGAFTKFFDKASPTGTINSLPDAVAGAAGGLPTTNGTKLSQTADLTAGQSIACSDKTGFSLLATTGLGNQTANLTGNLSGSVGSVTGAVGSVTAGVTLAASAIQAIWDALTSALTTAGSIGKRIVDYLTGDAYVRLGAPAGASHAADVAAVKTDTAAVKTKTDYLPSATAGAAGGVFIAGSNAATSVTTALTANITGNLSGSVGSVTGAVGSVTGAVGSVTGAVGSVTGAVGSVTGNVGGNVTGSVGSVAAGGIGVTSIATDAITAATVKADAVTKIQNGLATPTNITAGTITTVTNLTNAPTAGDLTATMKASVTTAASSSTPALSAGGVTAVQSGLATASALATVAGYVDTEVGAILTIVQKLDTALELNGGLYRYTVAALANAPSGTGASAASIRAEMDSNSTQLAKLGSPAHGSLAADIAAVSAGSGLDAAGVRAAVGLSAANLDTQLSAANNGAPPSAATVASQVRTELATELGRIDAAITSRLATAGYTAPPAAATVAGAVRTELTTELGRVDAAISTRLASASYTTPPTVVQTRQEMDANSTKLANLDTTVSSRLATSGYSAAPSAATVASQVRAELGTELARVDAAVSTRATPAQVNAEVVDALSVDTYAEPAAVPAATASLKDKIGYVAASVRNETTLNGTTGTETLKTDAGTTLATRTCTDDGTTVTKGKAA